MGSKRNLAPILGLVYLIYVCLLFILAFNSTGFSAFQKVILIVGYTPLAVAFGAGVLWAMKE